MRCGPTLSASTGSFLFVHRCDTCHLGRPRGEEAEGAGEPLLYRGQRDAGIGISSRSYEKKALYALLCAKSHPQRISDRGLQSSDVSLFMSLSQTEMKKCIYGF